LRDLSKVFMGLSLANSQVMTNSNTYIKLWSHEISRIFYDRLNNEEDRKWFVETVESISEKLLGIKPKDLMLLKSNFSEIFSLHDENPIYEEILEEEKLLKMLIDYQYDYNDKNRNKLNLVFFK